MLVRSWISRRGGGLLEGRTAAHRGRRLPPRAARGCYGDRDQTEKTRDVHERVA
ncbi:hypothetical protein D187_004351 [Cystobacter fuscus DSM 2262]|uniref:Uncharacterized protein n=1 Tax=Cystobacter fuscus (strain ATCC 25194 / DSM 2262 / NBRC 100088 / M29) TaxID=1242864 RepID=S9P775_CYSF2|nr:hypothetical protein D187_004351 [Cystobacter fuscus DSM 2262]